MTQSSNNSPIQPMTTDDIRIFEAYRHMREAYMRSNHRRRVEIIEKAFRFAYTAHRHMRRRNGDPYVLHPIAVARIAVEEMGLGSTSICAALLHDVVANSDYTHDDIHEAFGPKIASIVEGIDRISGGILGHNAQVQAEKFRKLLLSMSTDVRVVLVKMADRLHNMRTLDAIPAIKQQRVADETLYVYAPLAHRLGLSKMKYELEDLALRYKEPEIYADIRSKVVESEAERQEIVREFVEPVRRRLDEAGFKYEIKARVKSTFSIYNKMQKKGVPFEEVYDIYAVRVIFDNDDDSLEKLRCWQIYTFFTDYYQVHPGRLRDWTSTPKANGYRALHLTAMGNHGKWIEVQIRSRKMDDIAELGYAAHWKYKTGEESTEAELDSWMNTIKDILANPGPNAVDFLETIKLSLYSKEIYVFTPTGDLIALPSGSTVLDMAFAIHTQLGLHCVAAQINRRMVNPDHQLQSGDQVRIISIHNTCPTPAMLSMCHTAKARHKLRTWLARHRTPASPSQTPPSL